MDTIILEFLLGIVLGTAPVVLITTRTGVTTMLRTKLHLGKKPVHRARTRPIKRPTTKSRHNQREIKARRVRYRRFHRQHRIIELQPVGTVAAQASHAPVTNAALYTCPACGLEGPDTMMADHFLGSPSHQNGPVKPDPIKAEAVVAESEVFSSEEDARNSLRHLLQMLVPPRAFGRRHAQRTVNPLAQLVETSSNSFNRAVRR